MKISLFKNLLLILTITFFCKGNTLYWKVNGKNCPFCYLQLCLDKSFPPTVNQEKITKIEKLPGTRLFISTKDKYWILHYEGDPVWDWYVDDWRPL